LISTGAPVAQHVQNDCPACLLAALNSHARPGLASLAHTEQNLTRMCLTYWEVSFYLQRKVAVVFRVSSRAKTWVVFRELFSKIPMGVERWHILQ